MRRWAIRIVVFLLIGAIVNVAVAWGLALWTRVSKFSDVPQVVAVTGRAESISVRRHRGLGAVRIAVATPVANPPDTTQPMLESWIDPMLVPASAPSVRWFASIFDARGLPTVCLYSRIDYGQQPTTLRGIVRTERGISFGRKPESMDVQYEGLAAELPIGPVWSGLIFNTLFYAAILGLPFFAFALRRWRRIQRGLCPKCAYPVGTSDVCTECGAPSPRPSPSPMR